MKKLTLIEHPVALHKLARLRDRETQSSQFRDLMAELARLLTYEATRDLVMKEVSIETPLAKTSAKIIEDFPIVISIMRAGNGMLEGVLSMIPRASTGHIGMYRDKFINHTIEYFFRMPERSKGRMVLLIEPLLATGDTAVASVDRLKQFGVGKIRLLSLIVSPQGLEKLHDIHPDVEVYTLAVDPGLDSEGNVLPGIGDAGNRLYNTKD